MGSSFSKYNHLVQPIVFWELLIYYIDRNVALAFCFLGVFWLVDRVTCKHAWTICTAYFFFCFVSETLHVACIWGHWIYRGWLGGTFWPLEWSGTWCLVNACMCLVWLRKGKVLWAENRDKSYTGCTCTLDESLGRWRSLGERKEVAKNLWKKSRNGTKKPTHIYAHRHFGWCLHAIICIYTH